MSEEQIYWKLESVYQELGNIRKWLRKEKLSFPITLASQAIDQFEECRETISDILIELQRREK